MVRGPYHRQSMVAFVFPTAAAHSKWKIGSVPRTYADERRAWERSRRVKFPAQTPPHRRTFLRECLGARPFERVVGGGGLCGSIEKRAGDSIIIFRSVPASDGPLAGGLVFWHRVLDRERRER